MQRAFSAFERWWQSRTLRFRLAAWYAATGITLLSLFSATLYLYVAHRIAVPIGQQLRRDLDEVRRRLEVRPDGRLVWDGAALGRRSPWTTNDPWFELWDEERRLVRRRWPFSTSRVAELPTAPTRQTETISIFYVAPDIRLRVLSVPFDVPGRDGQWMIRVMRMHEPATDALQALRWILMLSLPIVVALLVVGGYAITRRWLRPLSAMVGEARRITPDDRARRLPVESRADELGQLGAVFNETLDRLEASFNALDRFVADASHELRSPLTALKSVGEVALRRPRTDAEYREVIGSMLEEAQRLELLTQRLLELATTEGGAYEAHNSDIAVDEYVTACAQELAVLAEQKKQSIVVDASPCRANTDPVILRQVLRNLVDNAIKFSPADSVVRLHVADAGENITVEVADAGPGISPESQARLAQRFFRPDAARARQSGGYGLGLSITKAYLRVLGGTLSYEPAKPSGSIFRVTLPKTPPGSAIRDSK